MSLLLCLQVVPTWIAQSVHAGPRESREHPILPSPPESPATLCAPRRSSAACNLPHDDPVLADRYRLDRVLGAGGMATVPLAHDLKHDRDVAINVLHPDLGGVRFRAEIRTTASSSTRTSSRCSTAVRPMACSIT